MSIITFQTEFRPALPNVTACKDYHEFRITLEEMDRILVRSGLEARLVAEKIRELDEELSCAQMQQLATSYRRALRNGILLGLTGLSFRALARRIADSSLFQWFTFMASMDEVRAVSKSTIERDEKLFSSEELTVLIHKLNQAAASEVGARNLLYCETELRMNEIFADATCVKANIHFPVDWVLLRDATRTLINAIILIRKHGLKHRIPAPEDFMRKMNKLAIEMTHTRKKRDAKKTRKHIFRRMKQLMKIIQQHAIRYQSLLTEQWSETELSELEAQVIIHRMQNILDQLPDAIDQAHERIIGERPIANKDKILSLYEPDTHVIVRGKADAEVEFGNGLYLAEQADGLIVDWNFYKDQPAADSKELIPSLKRIRKNYGSITSYTGDRGYDSKANTIELEKLDIINGVCPRSPDQLQEQLHDEHFCLLQKRRGSTEARIAIFKNAYLGKPLRSKGFNHRKLRIEWSILTHNLWKLASMAAQKRIELETAAAA